MAFSKEAATSNAARRRAILIAALGGCCIECGSTSQLEFHHTQSRDWVASKMSRWQRQLEYEKDWEAGVIELLCGDCNKRAGQPSFTDEPDGVPF